METTYYVFREFTIITMGTKQYEIFWNTGNTYMLEENAEKWEKITKAFEPTNMKGAFRPLR